MAWTNKSKNTATWTNKTKNKTQKYGGALGFGQLGYMRLGTHKDGWIRKTKNTSSWTNKTKN